MLLSRVFVQYGDYMVHDLPAVRVPGAILKPQDYSTLPG